MVLSFVHFNMQDVCELFDMLYEFQPIHQADFLK